MRINTQTLFEKLARPFGDGNHNMDSEVAPSRITFAVTKDYPERIIEAKPQLRRVIGQKGGVTIYAILAQHLSNNDINTACIVKSGAVNLLVNQKRTEDTIAPPTFADAYDASLSLLAKYATNEDKETIAYLVAHDIFGSGPLSILLEDSADIEEIEVNSPTSNIVIYHSKHGRCLTNLRFNSDRDFRYSINRLISATEKEINSSTPIIDAQLPEGSRVHAQLKPYAISGAAASIRLNGRKGINIARLIDAGTVSEEVLAYLWMAIETGQNIVTAGAPASGKTSLLLASHVFVPQFERTITIEEDVNELKFYDNMVNVVSLQGSTLRGKPNLRDQVINALHLRPDRLIIGELRGEEAREVFVGSNLGVPFMTTIHSSSNGQAILNRLASRPMCVEEHTLCMLDLSIFMRQASENSRLLDSIVEYRWLSRAETMLSDVVNCPDSRVRMVEIAKNGMLDQKQLKESKVISKYCEMNLVSTAEACVELKKRTKHLKRMGGDQGVFDTFKHICDYWEIK